MKFQKGHTFSRGKGRPKGTSQDFKKQLQLLIEDSYEKFKQELISIQGKSFVDVYIKLMEFTQPKMKPIELIIDTPAPDRIINFVLDESQLKDE